MLSFFKQRKVRFNLANALDCTYIQQNTLADIDKSFIRIRPIQGHYSRDSIKEAIYYAQCADIEIYEYQLAKEIDKLYEAIDVGIFILNVLAYLGLDPRNLNTIMILPIKNPKRALIKLHKQLSEILYEHIDYKQWKFPKTEIVCLSEKVENKLCQLACYGLGLAAYQACKLSSKYKAPETVLMNAIIHKMQISRDRAKQEVNNQKLKV